MKEKIKIVLSGLIFPLTIMRYFWNSLERRDDVDLFVLGCFSNNWIPWTTVPGDGSGMYLPQKYVKTPNLALPLNLPMSSARLVEPQMKSWCDNPDLWIECDAGWHFTDRPKAKKVVQLQTDPHVLQGHYVPVRDKYDLIFSMQFCYMQPGDIYIPYAYDPEIHYPMDLEKEYDVCLIGLQYPQRNELMRKLVMKGLKVYYNLGIVFDEYRETFNKSKIGLNWSTLQDLNARFFEIPAMGLPMVTNHVPDADKFLVPNKDFLEFETTEQAENHIDNLLKNEEFRDKVANSGHKKVKEHTYDNRVQMILEACGLSYEEEISI